MPGPVGFRRPTPKWAIYGGGAAALLAGGYLWYRARQNSNSSTASTTVSQSNASAPTLDSTGFLSNITDQSNNLPYEDTWPYNQLALPYNYTNQSSSTVNSNANLLMPYSTGSTLSTPVGS